MIAAEKEEDWKVISVLEDLLSLCSKYLISVFYCRAHKLSSKIFQIILAIWHLVKKRLTMLNLLSLILFLDSIKQKLWKQQCWDDKILNWFNPETVSNKVERSANYLKTASPIHTFLNLAWGWHRLSINLPGQISSDERN